MTAMNSGHCSHRPWMIGFCLLLFAGGGPVVRAPAAHAQAVKTKNEQKQEKKSGDETQQTDELQITSDTVDMNFGKKMATFRGNVVVCDDSMRLTADQMIVWLSEKDELKQIEATGNVVIQQLNQDRRAEAGKALYEVEKGTVVLTENPVVLVGKSSATGAEKITYFRSTETFRFESGSDQKIRPTITVKRKVRKGKEGGALPLLLGEESKDQGGKDTQ